MVRDILQEVSELLEKHNASSRTLAIALLGDGNKLWEFLLSNDLWGGAGSVADQALLELPEERRLLDGLVVRLGREQMRLGKVNVRTEMWVSAFEKWANRYCISEFSSSRVCTFWVSSEFADFNSLLLAFTKRVFRCDLVLLENSRTEFQVPFNKQDLRRRVGRTNRRSWF